MAALSGPSLEDLARAAFSTFSPAEINLIHAATTTHRAYCGPSQDEGDPSNDPEHSEAGSAQPWGPDREVRAELIRWLCLDRQTQPLVDARGLQLFGARVTGELDLRHATVPFPLSFVHCRLTDPAYFVSCQIPRLDFSGSWTGSISADGAAIKQHIFLCGTHVDGVVELVQAHIDGTLLSEGTTITGKDGVAVSADGIHVGDAFFRAAKVRGVPTRFSATGAVRLIGAEINGDLDCHSGRFSELIVERATIKGAMLLRGEKFGTSNLAFHASGVVNLTGASTASIEDEEGCWPRAGNLKLDGFTYSRIDPADAEQRLRWLQLDSSACTQPYRRLAQVLHDSGDARNSRRVLIAMEKKLSSHDRLRWLKALIGYGYRPGNAVWLLLGLWLLGAALCWSGYAA